MIFYQKEIVLPRQERGFHLITEYILQHLPELREMSIGTLNVFIKHTSASLTINENADFTVRQDLETWFSKTVPDGANYYKHDDEGPDDMPAHIKCTMIGASLCIPITKGRLNLGTWQGIYLCEHRNNHRQGRKLILTLSGIPH